MESVEILSIIETKHKNVLMIFLEKEARLWLIKKAKGIKVEDNDLIYFIFYLFSYFELRIKI